MNDMIVLTRDNFDEVLTQIKHCDNPENLPIIQINLIRPKMTFRLFWSLMICLGGLFVLSANMVKGNFDISLIVFFITWISMWGLGLTYEVKSYKIKLFFNNSDDIFYCRLTPTHFIYHLNGDELKLDWEKVADISYVWGGQMNQNHIMITQRNDDLLRIFKSQTTLNIKELEKPLTAYFHKCRTFNSDNKSVSLFAIKL
ncbi:Uncharacterised protein [Moraxella lacunata]|uniref:Uncharacterized protein n=1 Tax=Moraxella lacunata TaxID=477 RepID=A0A378TWZ2_MORLA|nr:hypothetical protein [Moraxella lacunata]STZ64283.1 Uncharacterised protein [Moraxella lacunata]